MGLNGAVMWEKLPNGILVLVSTEKHIITMYYNDGSQETWSKNPSMHNAMENFLSMVSRWS